MSATETSGAAAEAKRASAGKYVVLQNYTDAGEITDLLSSGHKVWIETSDDPLPAKDAGSAIKSVAVEDDQVHEGTYVAVPLSSFQPKKVKTVVQVGIV